MAGVTAWLSGVACDQGGCRAARTIGAERLRLTTGHLSWAISVGAEARSQLVGPAYCEDQRQSVSTLHSALSPSFLSLLRRQPSLCLPPVFLCCLSISLSFPLMCFCSSLANGCCLAICYPTVQLSLHYTLFDLFATSVELKSYNVMKPLHNPNAFPPPLRTFSNLLIFSPSLTLQDAPYCMFIFSQGLFSIFPAV